MSNEKQSGDCKNCNSHEKKQIEEMAKVMCGGCADGKECMQCLCADWYKAEKLYNTGYRKQSEGEWIEERYIDEKRSDFKCSVCEYDDTFYRNSIHRFYKYCPNCGARMSGGKNE
jgi:hypothetical protein